MKNRILFLAVMLLLASRLNAQVPVPFNHKIPDANYNMANLGGWGTSSGSFKKTIMHDAAQNIYVLNRGMNWPNWDMDIIKLDPTGVFIDAVAILNNSYQELGFGLDPICIIPSYDDQIIILGNYRGQKPTGFWASGNTINTIFYAKFTKSLTLIDFKLYDGYPLNNGGGIWATGITSISNQEHVIMASITGDKNIFIKIDDNINYLSSRIYDFGPDLQFLGSSIDYLPNNDVIAITGRQLGLTPHPGIMTISPALDPMAPLSTVHLPGSEELIGSCGDPLICLYYAAGPTNAIEDENDPTKLVWGINIFGTWHPAACENFVNGTLHGYIIKNDVATLAHINHREIVSCSSYDVMTELQKHPGSDNFAIGLTSATGGYDPILGVNFWTVKPALINMQWDFTPINMNIYNFNDYTIGPGGASTHGVMVYNANFLQSFIPFNGNLNDPSYILHVSHCADNTYANPYIRVINTEASGVANCNKPSDVYTNNYDPEIHQHEVYNNEDVVFPFDITPVCSMVTYTIDPCNDPPQRPSATNSKSITKTTFKVFPNPTNGNWLHVEGEIDDNSMFILEDMVGRKVYTQSSNRTNKAVLNLSNISNGLYVLRIYSNNKQIKAEKVIIN